jgi:NAD(P)-dependent dehydrogenase (short-subunit alcohol dehydrogenase family)
MSSTAMRLAGLDGRVALVTGAARGIGLRIAETLASLGARTVAADLSAPDLPGMLGVEMDVTDEASVDRAFSTVAEQVGAPDVLVLNAGVFVIEPTEEVTLASWRRSMAVNLDGPFLCVRRALPAMRERGFGRIVAIGSASGILADPVQCAAYSASKAGVMNLMKSVAREFSGAGITANAVAPALIKTPMVGDAIDGLAGLTLVGRVGETDDVAAAVAYLCSDHASYITGATLDVNGGYFIH